MRGWGIRNVALQVIKDEDRTVLWTDSASLVPYPFERVQLTAVGSYSLEAQVVDHADNRVSATQHFTVENRSKRSGCTVSPQRPVAGACELVATLLAFIAQLRRRRREDRSLRRVRRSNPAEHQKSVLYKPG